MRIFLPFALLIFCLTACDDGQNLPGPAGDILIRVENASAVDFTNIILNTDADYDYGDLAAGALTDYQAHGTAYRYAYISLEIQQLQYVIQPIDYVGEAPLEPGEYTYVLYLNETADQLFLELREEG